MEQSNSFLVPITGRPYRKTDRGGVISTSSSAAQWFRSMMSQEQEELWVLLLASDKSVIDGCLLFRGTANACLAHPRDIMRTVLKSACLQNAVSFVLGHNHPSGQLTPSVEDWRFTRRIIACGQLFQIPLIDHVIITATEHLSMRNLNERLFRGSR